MEVRQLEIFRTLAGELNFTRTAERVNTVQSNVTAQIKALEDELGTRLFDRLAKSVVLTDAGRRFLPYADRALTTMNEGMRVMKAGAEPEGALTIGAPESVLTYRLPEVLRRFHEKYPKVELQFTGSYSDAGVAAELESGRLDVAIVMTSHVAWPQMKSQTMGVERILVLSDPGHPLAKKKAVAPEDLAGQHMLLTEPGCGYRLKFDRALAAANVKPGVTEFSSVEAIKQCLRAGMGFGVLPEIVAMRELKAGQLAALRWAGPELDVGKHVVWHKDKWMSPNIAAFLKVLKETN